MKDKQTIDKILNILEEKYPDARVMLDYKTPLQLLIATILSAQMTDAGVNKITPQLFKKYKTIYDFANANIKELEKDIKSVNYYQTKAKNIISCCKVIIEKFKGKIPDNIDDLTSLPGVGRKTASVILANIYKIPSIAVDTHVKRVSQRIGFTISDNPEIIERDLCVQIPKEKWIRATHLLGFLGRNICTAKNQKCELCSISKFCDYAMKIKK